MKKSKIFNVKVFRVLYYMIVFFIVCGVQVSAKSDPTNIMDAFNQEAFKGNWSVLRGLNIIGQIMQITISGLSMLTLCTKSVTIIVTISYKSMQGLFDIVHEIKSDGEGKSIFLGMDAVIRSAAKRGKGIDAFLYMVLSLLPDLRKWSQYGSLKDGSRLKEDDTVVMYLAKEFIPSSLTFFFVSMGFNGMLWRTFIVTVDAMTVVTDEVISIEFDKYIKRAINKDGRYTFSYGETNTKYGIFLESIAKDMYKEVLRNSENLNPDTKYYVGIKIDEILREEFGDMVSDEDKEISRDIEAFKNTPGFKFTEADIGNLKLNVISSNIDTYPGTAFTVDMSVFGLKQKTVTLSVENDKGEMEDIEEEVNFYIHVFITRKKVTPDKMYFGKIEDSYTRLRA